MGNGIVLHARFYTRGFYERTAALYLSFAKIRSPERH